jgi:hypothetical protein
LQLRFKSEPTPYVTKPVECLLLESGLPQIHNGDVAKLKGQSGSVCGIEDFFWGARHELAIAPMSRSRRRASQGGATGGVDGARLA